MIEDRIDLCLAAPLFYPVFTGAGMRFQRYAPGLKARGIDMSVFASAAGEVTSSKLGIERSSVCQKVQAPWELFAEIPVRYVQMNGKSAWQRNKQYTRALLDHCLQPETRPDVLHLLSPSPFSLVYYRSLRGLEIPIVLSHTLLSELSHRRWKRLLQRLLVILSYQISDCIVAPTSCAATSLTQFGLKKPISIIPNGVDLERFQPQPDQKKRNSLRQQLGINPEANVKVLLYVGSLTRRKGIHILLKAWENIAKVHSRAFLVLVGPPPQEMGQRLHLSEAQGLDELLSNIAARDRVLFAGQVDNPEAYYQAADVFLFPSKREGMPNVLLEAFSSGLPSVVTPFLGISPELGRPGKEFILAKRSADAIAGAAIELLDDPLRRSDIGTSARLWVEDHLSLEKSLDLYAKLYRDWAIKQ